MRKLSASQSSDLPDKVFVLEYIYCVLLLALLVVSLAIASFDPGDPSLFNVAATASSGTTISNIFGPLGATLADWFYQLFGLGALVFSLVFIAQLLSAFQRPRMRSRWILRLFGYPQLILCYLGLLCAISPEWKVKGAVFLSGGFVGHKVYLFFASLLGQFGAGVALAFGVIASLPLCLGIRPINFILNVFEKLPSGKFKSFARQVKEKEPASENSADTTVVPAVFGRKKTADIDNNETPIAARATAADFGLPRSEPRTSFTERDAETEHRMIGPAEFQGLVELLEFHGESDKEKNLEEETARLKQEAKLLEEKMSTFGVLGNVTKSQPGPVVNVHEFEPAAGIKVTKVLGLQDDLALGLKAQSVLMAPQPGKSTIGIEVPSHHREVVSLREIMDSHGFQHNRAPLPMVLGKLVDGSPLVADLSSMPHLLVAGATGSGKSVGINCILLSLMMSRTPKQLRLILVDPKMLELSNYDGIGHLLMPVVTEPQKAASALKWAINEMEKRYRLMKLLQVRNIASYNSTLENEGGEKEVDGVVHQQLPYIVVVIDELCDLMMTAPKDVEDSVQRLAQKARAAGIHLVLATQRPSVDVLTGVIKANLPCRISYQVTSKHDSRTIIETIGAEKLLGKGDMLFLPPGTSKLVRAHGAYVGDKEINAVADKLRQLYPARYEAKIMDEVERVALDMSQKNDEKRAGKVDGAEVDGNEMDENTLYERAVETALSAGAVSISSIQRHYRIGYNRAARIIERMEKEGLVGPNDVAGKPRQVLVANR